MSARHWQLKRNGAQWFCGKTFDTFSPIGPAIVTRDAMDPNTQPIKCFLNGEVVQSSNTDQLIFRCDFLVSWCSQFMTLKPGDLIFTGTPPGVGCFRKPPLWLKPGDEVTCEIGQIGAITNAVVAHAPVYESFEPPACSSMDALSRRVLNLETRMRAFDAGGDVSESADLAIDTMQAAELRSEVRAAAPARRHAQGAGAPARSCERGAVATSGHCKRVAGRRADGRAAETGRAARGRKRDPASSPRIVGASKP